MRWSKLTVTTLTTMLAHSIAIPHTHIIHESRDVTSERWVKRDRVPHDAILPVRIGLAQSNLDQAHAFLMDVSDPSSPNYGKHWTAEQVVETFKPSDETTNTVLQWIVAHGVSADRITHSDNKVWFAFDARAHEVESLLLTEFHDFEDQRTGIIIPACEQYHVPKDIQRHVDYITPGVKLLGPAKEARDQQMKRSRLSTSSLGLQQQLKKWSFDQPLPGGWNGNNLSSCDVVITPACIAALYQFTPGSLAHPNNSMGILESELEFWDQKDLNLFFANFAPHIPQGTHPTDYNIDGAVSVTHNVTLAGAESMIDLDLAYPIVHPQTISIFNEDDLYYQAHPHLTYGFNTFLDAIDGSYCTYSAYGETGDLPGGDPTYPDPAPNGFKGKLQCGVYTPTNVFSISYSGQEVDVPIAYQRRQCNEYLKLGLQGHSLFFSTADSGIGNYPMQQNGYDGPTGCLGPKYNIFNPTWPNTCPYVTNVGATKVYPGRTVFEPESAAYVPAGNGTIGNFTSGGGFSNVYAIPNYQKAAVATYFAEHDPKLLYYSELATRHPQSLYSFPNITALAGNTSGIYNRIGRGIPDVAANGDNIATYIGGEFVLSSGTSASTPIFASIINRINEERLAIGKTPVGFINPALYAHPEVLNDITNGTNAACFEAGFEAVKGWDPVTGLGTPNYPKMLKLFLSLP